MNEMSAMLNFAAESQILTILRILDCPVDVSLLAQTIGIDQQKKSKKRQTSIENLEMVLSSLEEKGRIQRDAEGIISI